MTPSRSSRASRGLHGAARDAEHPRVLAHAGLRLLEQEVEQVKIELIQMHRPTAPYVTPSYRDVY